MPKFYKSASNSMKVKESEMGLSKMEISKEKQHMMLQ